MKPIYKILLCAALTSLSACATTQLPQLADEDIPANWQYSREHTDENEGEIDGGNKGQRINLSWWQSFNSTELNHIITKLETRNFDLANLQRNLEQAQLELRGAGLELLPNPIVSLGLNKSHIGTRADNESYEGQQESNAELNLGFSYADILTKPAQHNASLAVYDNEVANLADLRLNVQSTAASTYFQILLIRDRIRAAKQSLLNAQSVAKIIQTRANAGAITPIDALQQRIVVQRRQNDLKSLQQNELATRASLATLLAQPVSELTINTDSLDELSIPTVNAGTPLELLRRRPDLVAAEANLRLFRANVDLARLSFLPTLSVTGNVNLVSGSLSRLIDQGNLSTNLLGSIVQTLLDNGARRRSLRRNRLDLESSLATYRNSVISAFNEIEVSLSNITLLKSLSQVAKDDLKHAKEAYRIAKLRYQEGVEQFQTLLTTQDTLSSVQTSFYDSKLAGLNATVALHQSLGGGWQPQDNRNNASKTQD